MQKTSEMRVTDKQVLKVRENAMTQLAAPYFHNDSVDWNEDGHAGIVVNADNDICSGPPLGARYMC